MLGYALRRLAAAVPVAFVVSLICFMLVQLAPGDPLSVVLPADASQEQIDATMARYGLDRPLVVQYALWLGNVVTGDLGTSIATGRPVASDIGNALGYSLSLALLAAGMAVTLGMGLGLLAGYSAGGWVDKLASAIAISGVSVPHYWLGIVLVVIFSAELNWLPAMGAASGDPSITDHLRHMILPAIALAAMPTGIITRSVRALVAETLGREFVSALVARGLGAGAVFAHVVKNVAPTALAVLGVQVGYLMAGSILVETVFAWPGTGSLLNQAILQRDLPLLQGTILVLALIFVTLNLIVDIVQPLFDPRISRS
jgi:peptide/nickel transport system permease protein